MKMMRFVSETGATHYGVPRDEHWAEILDGTPLRGVMRSGRMVRIGHLLPPIEPRAILCIGLNYREHAKETGAAIPERPVMFMKNPAATVGSGGAIRLPKSTLAEPEVDYECELAVVIGKDARNVSVDDALEHVLGYTIGNDVSARIWQKKRGGGGQWVRGKSFDTFCPLGPVILTPDELPDPQNLSLKTTVNDQVLQDGHSSDMIFSVAEIISEISQDLTLLAGTVLLTGTPPGVGVARDPQVFLQPGDAVRCEIEGIGVLENTVAAAD